MTPSRSTPQLLCVGPESVHLFWPHIAPLLKSAVLRTDLSRFEEIESDVLLGRSLLWLAWSGRIEAAATTILTDTDSHKICVLAACGGRDMRRWLALLKEIEAYAKAEGCSRMRIFGRKGWERVLEHYNVTNIVLERKL